MPKGRFWTKEDEDLFRHLWARKDSIEAIAAQLNRTVDAITTKRINMKLKPRPRGNKPSHPVIKMQPGESMVIPMTRQKANNWHTAARRNDVKITTRAVMLKGQIHYRITRLAA